MQPRPQIIETQPYQIPKAFQYNSENQTVIPVQPLEIQNQTVTSETTTQQQPNTESEWAKADLNDDSPPDYSTFVSQQEHESNFSISNRIQAPIVRPNLSKDYKDM